MRSILALAIASLCMGQAFAAASVKALKEFRPRMSPPVSDPAHLHMPSVPLSTLMMRAYNVHYDQIMGPAWMDDQYYDIEAKLPEGAAKNDIPAMLQALLADRFGMTVHWQKKPVPAYALLLGKNGPKLKAPADATLPPAFITAADGSSEVARNITMDHLSRTLAIYLDEPVVDMTGLAGKYDLTLEMEPDPDKKTASIFAAVQKLGLRLEPRKIPIDHIVIDRVNRFPSEN